MSLAEFRQRFEYLVENELPALVLAPDDPAEPHHDSHLEPHANPEVRWNDSRAEIAEKGCRPRGPR